jgi:hypothetical protein
MSSDYVQAPEDHGEATYEYGYTVTGIKGDENSLEMAVIYQDGGKRMNGGADIPSSRSLWTFIDSLLAIASTNIEEIMQDIYNESRMGVDGRLHSEAHFLDLKFLDPRKIHLSRDLLFIMLRGHK